MQAAAAVLSEEQRAPADGIALWALANFVRKHRTQIGTKSTSAVCAAIIKPATQSGACAYAELLRSESREGSPAVASATVFASHAWDNTFMSLANTLLAGLSMGGDGKEGDYVWIDVFMARALCMRPRTSGLALGGPARLEFAPSMRAWGVQPTLLNPLYSNHFTLLGPSCSCMRAAGVAAGKGTVS